MLQLHLCCVFVGWVCVCVEWRDRGSFEKGPNIPQVSSDEGRGCVLGICVSDEGDRRLAGSASGYEGNLLCFINFNVASVKGDMGIFQFKDLRWNVAYPLLYKTKIRTANKLEETRHRGGADSASDILFTVQSS